MVESMDTQIAQLADFLRQSQRAVVFSGMGISTESGPAKFRTGWQSPELVASSSLKGPDQTGLYGVHRKTATQGHL